MKVLYVGQILPERIYNKYYLECRQVIDSAPNVFYNALLKGLHENGAEVTCRTYLPSAVYEEATAGLTDGIQWKKARYTPNLYLRIIKNFFISGYDVLRWKKGKQTECVAVFNVLRISQSIGALLMCKLLGVKTLTIVTDVPGYRIQSVKQSAVSKLADWIGQKIIAAFDHYVFLSEAMKEVVPLGDKPYVVVEGIYDEETEVAAVQEKSVEAEDDFIVMYAGSLHYKYGVMNLVRAVQQLGDMSIKLHIYGTGEAADEIGALSEKYTNIQYKGSVCHNEILRLERTASLLVNPRPVDDEYVKFSFPSKNMEYMASGTPVLLTNIPSLPKEYRDYVTIVPDNRVQVIAEKIAQIKQAEKETGEYTARAQKARNFILQNKNKKKQSKKIMELIGNGV